MFGIDINGFEFLILIVIAVIVLGPDKLPEYAAKLAQLVRKGRTYAEGARSQLREQMGPEFDDIDWKQYDVRQYDPRRIVREALQDDDGNDIFTLGGNGATASRELDGPLADEEIDEGYDPAGFSYRSGERYDPTYTPYDIEAT